MNLTPVRIVEYLMMFVVLFYTISILFLFVKNRKRFHQANPKYSDWEPKVSIVVPAYNEEEYVGRMIQSILDADYPKDRLELIVVDDGSTDDTAKVVRSFKDKRVVLLQKENSGNAAIAKNYGIQRAKGEIIFTLDADSWITKDAIRKVLSHFDDDVAAVTAAVKVQPKEKMSFLENLQHVEYMFTIFNRRIFSFINGVWVTPGPFSAFRRGLFDEIGVFDPKNIMEDQEMALRIQSANYRIASSTDATVYTAVPNDLKSFYRQRLRWNRGGIRNILSYNFLTHYKYGDFGAFIMPISLASIGLLFAVLLIVSVSLKAFSPLNFDVLLTIEPIHLFSAAVIALTALWTWIALKEMDASIDAPLVIAYMFIYSYLISFFTIIALVKEIKGDDTKW